MKLSLDALREKVEPFFDPERFEEFWRFITERQAIYVRRMVEGRPAPWTEDPALKEAFFTNVYRELDQGTIYALKNVIDQGNPVDELFEILVYRLFNNRHTYDAMKTVLERPFGDWSDWPSIVEFLRLYAQETGKTIFTNAHMTAAVKWGGFESKVENICWLLHEHWKVKEATFMSASNQKSLKELWQYISSLTGYGGFLAYEVVTDMNYSTALGWFTEDDWANPGPGCKDGIDRLIPERIANKISYEDAMLCLRYFQREYFAMLDCNFQYLKNKDGDEKELSLRNIEHSLCEYSKYFRARHLGYMRRKYRGGYGEFENQSS